MPVAITRCDSGLLSNEQDEMSGCEPAVSVVESTNHRNLNYFSHLGRLNRSRLRRVLVEREVRSRCVVISEVQPKVPTQMVLVQHNDVIEAVSA